jgi:hypothetical protein
MIKSFNTSGSAPSTTLSSGTTTSSGGMNKAIMVLALLGVAYIGYRFVVKPMLDKKKEEK